MNTGDLKVPSQNTYAGQAGLPQGSAAIMERAFPEPADAPADKLNPENEGKGVEGILPIKISIILPTNAYFASGIRDFSMTLARNMSGFSKQWAYRFQSVVDELINNAIEFGSRPGEEIGLTFVSVENKYIEVFVEDTGTGKNGMKASGIIDFVEKRKKMDPTAITSIRGRGLAQIVSKWADKLEIADNAKGGITAHVIKKFQKDEEMVIPL